MPKITRVDCPVRWQTPDDADYLFGFNDISPWSPSGEELLVLRVPGELDRLPGERGERDKADLCIWNPAEGSMRRLAETLAWNFQQGARQRWLSDDRIMFNYLSDGHDRAAVISREGEVVTTFSKGIYAVSPDGSKGLSPSFGRVHAYNPGYGYPALAPGLDEIAPSDDGLWEVDLATGAVHRICSLFDIARAAPLPGRGPQFVSHIWYSPSGDHFLFVHALFAPDGGAYANLMVMARDGSNLRCVASERISHPCWLDDQTIVAWSRTSRTLRVVRRRAMLSHPLLRRLARLARSWQGRSRNLLFGEGLISHSIDGNEPPKVIGSGSIDQNGHFSVSPSGNLLLGDTYPDKNQQLHLYVYHLRKHIKVDIGVFKHGVRWSNGHLRSDLHPRWNRAGDQVAVDISCQGVRRVAIVDVTAALRALGELPEPTGAVH